MEPERFPRAPEASFGEVELEAVGSVAYLRAVGSRASQGQIPATGRRPITSAWSR